MRFSTNLDKIPEKSLQISKNLAGGEVLALIGDLGSGKTTFTKLLAKQLAITKPVPSPTFPLLQTFQGTLPKNKKTITLYHLDLYRTKTWKEVSALGIEEFWQQPNTITIIEWAEKIEKHLPKNTLYVYFSEKN